MEGKHTNHEIDQKIKQQCESVAHMEAIENMDGADVSFLSDYSVRNAMDRRNDEAGTVRDHSEGGELHVPTEAQAVLWTEELSGQISDGLYENDRRLGNGNWEKFSYADVIVNESIDQPKFKYESGSVETLMLERDVTEHDGLVGRMLFWIRMMTDQDGYDVEDLREDLSQLEQATREA